MTCPYVGDADSLLARDVGKPLYRQEYQPVVECEACAFAAVHHHWPNPDQSHCRRCHAGWRIGTRTIHCVKCHRTFTTPGVLDMHKVKGNECVDPASLTGSKAMRAEPNAWGTMVWRSADRRPPATTPPSGP